MSMRQLARACGVQVAAIYHYFDSKDALLTAVIEERRYSSRLIELDEIDASGSLDQRLRDIFELFWRGALDEEPVLRLLLGEALRHQQVALPTGSELLQVFRSGVQGLLEVLAPEIDDRAAAAEQIVAQVFAAFIRHIFEPQADVAEIGRHHADLVLAALSCPPR